jgi:hypothetical protein
MNKLIIKICNYTVLEIIYSSGAGRKEEFFRKMNEAYAEDSCSDYCSCKKPKQNPVDDEDERRPPREAL